MEAYMVALRFPSWKFRYEFCYGKDLQLHTVRQTNIIASIVELIGWVGRTWSSRCVYNQNPFLMQISTLIIGERSSLKPARMVDQS